MNELFNPCPIYSNATGDIPGYVTSALSLDSSDDINKEFQTMQDIYQAYYTIEEDTSNGHRKRKFDDANNKDKSAKLKLQE